MSEDMEERGFKVTASTTITATFIVYAESEEDAHDLVSEALVVHKHAFDYNVEVPNAAQASDDGWDVHEVVTV